MNISWEKNDNSIYENVFKTNNKLSKKVIEQFSNFYTTDTNYLKQTQKLIKTLKTFHIVSFYKEYAFILMK